MDANTKANQEIKADEEQMKETMERQIGSLVSRMEADRKTNRDELREEIKSGQAEMKSIVNAWIQDMKDGRKKAVVCQETTEARLECEEPTSVDMESESEQREFPKKNAMVKPVVGRRKWRRDRNLPGAEGKDPGILCILEKSDRCQQKDDPLRESGTAQERIAPSPRLSEQARELCR
jgi:hypothetical protein